MPIHIHAIRRSEYIIIKCFIAYETAYVYRRRIRQ